MDSEELAEIAFHQKNGRPETTKGPYYHKTWWESYKGAVKGILGGIVIGGLVGAATGGIVIAALTFAVQEVAPFAGIIMASTTLFGMYEGKEKFERVGATTGAVAAASEVSEVRMKQYVREKFTGVINEIRELKAVVAGRKSADSMQTDAAAPDTSAIFDESDFKTTHCDDHCVPKDGKMVYWKVATIGAMVGTMVTALLTFAGMGGHELARIIGTSTIPGADAALVVAGATLGASFGVNRDVFRKIFDVTDCWFAGVAKGNCSGEDIARAHGLEPPHLAPHKSAATTAPPVKTIIDASIPTTTISESTIAARNALLSMDHTTAMRH